MKTFKCQCGQSVYFDNNVCMRCSRLLAYSLETAQMLTLEPDSGQRRDAREGASYQFCANRNPYDVCNGVVKSDDGESYCIACRLNLTIPDLSINENIARWRRIEQAKRRLIYGLLYLKLPLTAPVADYSRGLSFEFLQDQRSNPNVPEEFVTTGHKNGIITINVLEADDVARARQREQNAERYRTVLGHFRHEVGHYYYELLVKQEDTFKKLFGDPLLPYIQALKNHYDGPKNNWEKNYISAYASSHPLEDWAECFAHYLHTIDTIETAIDRKVINPLSDPGDINSMLNCWENLSITLNELNRSLGLRDAYPFIVTPNVAEKLSYVHNAMLSLEH